jgi:hypothetical protein
MVLEKHANFGFSTKIRRDIALKNVLTDPFGWRISAWVDHSYQQENRTPVFGVREEDRQTFLNNNG